VRGALKPLEPGVKSTDITAGRENFSVTYDPNVVKPEQITAALKKTGEPIESVD
jgi:hypothetical protein